MVEQEVHESQASVGVIGLGPMGAPIAHNLIRAGLRVSVWNRTASRAEPFAGSATVVRRPDELRVGVVLSVLPDVPELLEVADDATLAAWRTAGTTHIVIMSTTSPQRVAEFAAHAARFGISTVDAPMSGGDQGAREGTLSIMVGGADADVAAVLPILRATAGLAEHMGALGAGSVAKLCNQVVVAAALSALAEALAVARSCELDLTKLTAIFGGGLADSAALQMKKDRLLNRSYQPGGSVRNQLKDLRYARELTAGLPVATPLLDLCTDLYGRAADAGLGELDHSVVQEVYLNS